LTIATEQAIPETAKTPLTVSVIVCAYSMERREILREGIASVSAQTRPPLETLLVIDNNEELLAWARDEFPRVRVVPNARGRGSSEAKNTAVDLAMGDALAFLDDDAIAAETWLEELVAPFEDPAVFGTSGMPIPRWESGQAPEWLPVEFYWTIGCGYRGLPDRVSPIRNPIGATMAFRKSVFARAGGFSSGLGPNMSAPGAHGGGEETELGIRAGRAFPTGKLLHVPGAQVEHQVPSGRTEFAYFRRRCWLEGRAKALLSAMVGAGDGLASERAYTLKTLPSGIMRGLWDAIRGDLSGLWRAGAIAAGLGFTSAGYFWGLLMMRIPRAPRSAAPGRPAS
jgi:glycosyltransferase involved in cell wall biosynthesis